MANALKRRRAIHHPLRRRVDELLVPFDVREFRRDLPRDLVPHHHPVAPRDLARHSCISIRQGDSAYGVWQLTGKSGTAHETESVRIDGNLTTNDGEIAVKWALDAHGILMRAE